MNGVLPEPVPIRECLRRTLTAATEPLTTRHLAELVDTTHPQAARGLRRLEDEGAAVRQVAAGGCYEWRAAK